MKKIVLDASVALKWYFPAAQEPLADEALRVMLAHRARMLEVVVPDVFWPEVGNVLTKGFRQGRIAEDVAPAALGGLRSLGFATVPALKLLEFALAITMSFRCSFYDALYLALAQESALEFITADERLVNAVGTYLPVRWLGVWRP